jgi:hypothetical protein
LKANSEIWNTEYHYEKRLEVITMMKPFELKIDEIYSSWMIGFIFVESHRDNDLKFVGKTNQRTIWKKFIDNEYNDVI